MRKGRRIQEIKGERVKKTQKHSRKLGSGRERKDLCFLAIFIAGTFFFIILRKKIPLFIYIFFSSIYLAPEGRGNKVSFIQFIFFIISCFVFGIFQFYSLSSCVSSSFRSSVCHSVAYFPAFASLCLHLSRIS